MGQCDAVANLCNRNVSLILRALLKVLLSVDKKLMWVVAVIWLLMVMAGGRVVISSENCDAAGQASAYLS
jgi:hypothetical protein